MQYKQNIIFISIRINRNWTRNFKINRVLKSDYTIATNNIPLVYVKFKEIFYD
jgi:hypothetical protein